MSIDQQAAEAFLDELYPALLRRPPTAGERAAWSAQLANGQSMRDVLRAIVRGVEYRSWHAVPLFCPPGHFFSPVVDPDSVRDYVEREWDQLPGRIAGIAFDLPGMLAFWQKQREFIRTTPFREEPGGGDRYHVAGSPYPLSDAVVLRAMIGAHRPKRIIEIGSGSSTACILDSADHVGLDLRLTCIEPYPERMLSLLRPGDQERITLIERAVQLVPPEEFADLGPGDILFIDSTHVLKTGSDVHYELFHILPVLRPGVLVHFHDCRYPFEYPHGFIFERNYSWNEAYAVRAFLMYNPRFRIIFHASLFARRHRKLVAETFPAMLANPGSSLWLEVRRRPLPAGAPASGAVRPGRGAGRPQPGAPGQRRNRPS